MARLLYRLGGFCFRRRWAVVGVWLVLLALVAILAGLFKGSTNDTFSVPGTDPEKALSLLDARFPGTGGAMALVVFAAPAGHTLTESRYKSIVQSTAALAEQVPGGRPSVCSASSADLVVAATGYLPQQDFVRRYLGDQVADRIRSVGGFDHCGDQRNMFQRTNQPGLWFTGGGFPHARINARFLALQIAMVEAGILDRHLPGGRL